MSVLCLLQGLDKSISLSASGPLGPVVLRSLGAKILSKASTAYQKPVSMGLRSSAFARSFDKVEGVKVDRTRVQREIEVVEQETHEVKGRMDKVLAQMDNIQILVLFLRVVTKELKHLPGVEDRSLALNAESSENNEPFNPLSHQWTTLPTKMLGGGNRGFGSVFLNNEMNIHRWRSWAIENCHLLQL